MADKKLHHATLRAAVAKYGEMKTEGKSDAEIKKAIAEDEKGWDKEEQAEVFDALSEEPADEDEPKATKKSTKKGATEQLFALQQFRDINDFSLQYGIGDTRVNDFTDKRKAELKEAGLIGNKAKLDAIQGQTEEDEA